MYKQLQDVKNIELGTHVCDGSLRVPTYFTVIYQLT